MPEVIHHEDSGSGSGINTVLIVLLIIIILVGGFLIYRGWGSRGDNSDGGGLNVNVDLPGGNNDGGSNTGGGSGGGNY